MTTVRDPEKLRAYTDKWRAANRSKHLAARRKWRAANRAKVNAAKRERWERVKDDVNPCRRLERDYAAEYILELRALAGRPARKTQRATPTTARELRAAGLSAGDFL